MFKYEQAHGLFGADLFGAYCQLRVLSERSRQGDCFISIPQGEGGAAPARTSNGVERRARRAAYNLKSSLFFWSKTRAPLAPRPA